MHDLLSRIEEKIAAKFSCAKRIFLEFKRRLVEKAPYAFLTLLGFYKKVYGKVASLLRVLYSKVPPLLRRFFALLRESRVVRIALSFYKRVYSKIQLLLHRLFLLFRDNRGIRLMTIELMMGATTYALTKSANAVSWILLLSTIKNMAYDYEKLGVFSLKKTLKYNVILIVLISSLIYKNLMFLQAKVVIGTYLLALNMLLSPFFIRGIDKNPYLALYSKILGVRDLNVLRHINFITGLYTLGLCLMNVWIIKYYEVSWIWFKSALVPILIMLYITVQFILYGQKLEEI